MLWRNFLPIQPRRPGRTTSLFDKCTGFFYLRTQYKELSPAIFTFRYCSIECMSLFYFFASSPCTRFFSTLYPEPIVLSAGTSYSLPITFRPLEKSLYEDKIEFQTKVRYIFRFLVTKREKWLSLQSYQ